MKSFPERRLDERLDGHGNTDPELDELVDLAHHLKRTSQPDPIFAQRLEQKIRTRSTLLQLQNRSWWSAPPWWVRTVLVALSVCIFLSVAITFVQASSPGSPLYPVKSWTQHMIGLQTNQDKNTNGQTTPHIQPIPTLTPYAPKTPASAERPNITPTATESSVNKNNSNTIKPSTIAVPVTPTVAVSPTPTSTPTPTPEPIVCLLQICL